jgi:poly(A) polymerase
VLVKIHLLERALAKAEERAPLPHDPEGPKASVRKYLDAILVAPRADLGLEHLNQTGILETHFPEVAALVGFGGAKEGHKDLWDHVKIVVIQTTPAEAHLRWAALFHDVGKPICFKKDEGKVSFHGHEIVSARLWGKFCRRSKLFGDQMAGKVGFLVKHLGHVESYEPGWTDSAIRRMLKEVGVHFEDLVSLSRADMTTSDPNKRARNLRRIDELVLRVQELEREAQKPRARKGLGLELGEALGLPPGRDLGKAMKAVTEAVEAGQLSADLPVEYYVSWWHGQTAGPT